MSADERGIKTTGRLRIVKNNTMAPPDARTSETGFVDVAGLFRKIMERLQPGEGATVTLEGNEGAHESEVYEVVRTD